MPTSSRKAAAEVVTSRSRSRSSAARSLLRPAGGASSSRNTGWPGRSSRTGGISSRAASHSSVTACSSPMSIRGRERTASAAKRLVPRPDGTTFAPRWHRAAKRSPSRRAAKRPSPRVATSARNTRSIGSSSQKARTSSRSGRLTSRTPGAGYAGLASNLTRSGTLRCPAMPIHVRAQPGDYAEACLVPGDPLRAKYVAETFLDGAEQRNAERGMLGFTGTYKGKPVSVQATGMGCPSAAIVVEELVQLGVKRILRIGTCGGLQPDMKLGDLVVAISAVAGDQTAMHYVGGEPHAPTADWELVHAAVHAAKELGKPVRVGPIVSSDVFYDPDQGRAQRWSDRGILAVEMEAAVLFTLGALRKVKTGCLLTVSDVIVEGEFVRISDEEMKAAVDQMTELALETVTA